MRRWISPRPSKTTPLDTALRFLAQRPRTEYEVRQRLRRAGVDEAAAEATLRQLRQHRLVDDAAFARYWLEQRQTFRPRGARLLRAELARLGVEATLAREVTASESEAVTAEDAYRAAARRAGQLRGLERRAFEARLGAFLGRRGFEWDTIAGVVERLWQETHASPDEAE
jgi:regulatory protein